MGVKDFIKKSYSNYQKKAKEDRAYNKILQDRIKIARRQSFADESVKQAKLKATLKAKQVYNPSPQQQGGMSPAMNNLLYGGLPPQQTQYRTERIKTEIKKRKKPKKKYKYSTRKVAVSNPQQDQLNKLLYGS